MPGLLRCRFRSPLFQERTPAQSQPLLKFLLSRIYLPSLVVLTATRNVREQRTEQFSSATTRARCGFEPSCHRNCLMVTDSGRWSAPAFIEIGGGSFGAQIGGSATDLVLIFTARKALERCRPVAGPSWRGTPEKAASGYTTPTPTTRAAYGAQFPVIVLDVHEHAYSMDYGADRKAYLKVFWKISTGAKPTICSNGLP